MIAAVILITLKFITSYNEAMDSAFGAGFSMTNPQVRFREIIEAS